MMKKQQLKCKVSMKQHIQQWMVKTDQLDAFNITIDQLEVWIDECSERVQEQAKKKSENWRSEFLDLSVEARAKAKDIPLKQKQNP
jgi:hypothetical protein